MSAMIKECADRLANKLKTIAEENGKLQAKEYVEHVGLKMIYKIFNIMIS